MTWWLKLYSTLAKEANIFSRGENYYISILVILPVENLTTSFIRVSKVASAA